MNLGSTTGPRQKSLSQKARDKLSFTSRFKSKSVDVQKEGHLKECPPNQAVEGLNKGPWSNMRRSFRSTIQTVSESIFESVNTQADSSTGSRKEGVDDKASGERRRRGKRRSNNPTGKSSQNTQIQLTMDYVVLPRDSLASIAAQFKSTPSELCSLNRLLSRTVFEGMTIKVPNLDAVAELEASTDQQHSKSPDEPLSDNEGDDDSWLSSDDEQCSSPQKIINSSGHRKAPGLAERVLDGDDEFERENDIRDRKFVKMEVKYITDGEGFINGTLLVTPNSFMFDPNVSDVLVLERGHEHFAVQAPLENILSLAMYRDPQIMMLSSDKRAAVMRDISQEEALKLLYTPSSSPVPLPPIEFADSEVPPLMETADKTAAEEPKEGAGVSSPNTMCRLLQEAASDGAAVEVPATSNTQLSLSCEQILCPTEERVSVDYGEEKVNDSCSHQTPMAAAMRDSTTDSHMKVESIPLVTTTSVDSIAELSALCKPHSNIYQEFAPRSSTFFTNAPLYLCICLASRKLKMGTVGCGFAPSSGFTASSVRGKTGWKREYWFSIPREQADFLYAFLMQYGVNQYGEDTMSSEELEARGFVLIDNEALQDDYFSLEERDHGRGSEGRAVRRFMKMESLDWEIVNREELERSRRIDLLEAPPETLPLPALHGQSKLLVVSRLRHLQAELPPRAEGHDWHMIYCTEEHGFSLNSLYRRCQGLDAACLLVLKDDNDHVFGAMCSCPFQLSEHFIGTGETYVFRWLGEESNEIFEKFAWSGENNYFVKGGIKCLTIGSYEGRCALWLDDNLYHGRSQACTTFNSPPLTAQEDFTVRHLEVWVFAD